MKENCVMNECVILFSEDIIRIIFYQTAQEVLFFRKYRKFTFKTIILNILFKREYFSKILF